ncbi:uncharacterized protein LOC122047172 [Zingiber officinale]|uniref:Uncharacterized protein n=1 Tax=Zingiber officinale TaxID=94328 RepID=A0A8J5LFS6_ZINOF|nr:uncharacterized protein LOC122047172 [Zingiber officinale]KAG6525883.1 hypothetical protein ZIOFF_015854 [Zingiber officinale]
MGLTENLSPTFLTTGDPCLDLADTVSNASTPRPPMGLTENLSPTFLSTGDPCLDFFFQIVPDTPAATVAELLSSAWEKEAPTALKLICHLRGVRGTGKSDREGFYSSALWLHRHHPKTLTSNLQPISEFGYLKDLPEILHRLVAGDDARAKAKASRIKHDFHCSVFLRRSRKLQVPKKEGTREERIAAETAKRKELSAQAAEIRHTKRAEMAVRAIERYGRDPDYRCLHDRVADVFAELLSVDLRHLSEGELTKISLAAKWCPTPDSSFDRSILLCETVARRLFPRDTHPDYTSLEEEHYAYRVRDRLRREALVPLRRALELPEVYMSAGQWSVLPYNHVASVAMKNYKKLFAKHDAGRFDEYIDNVKKGKAKIAAGALLPHEILKDAGDDVAELQWKRMIEDLSTRGSLRNCIAVCDVSGSMRGTPIEVCVALGLLISELSEDPWKGRVITFSESPELHLIKGDSLQEKTEFIYNMDWGTNTDFQKVFDKMLAVAVEGKLPPEAMVKRLFVFSDMEFDEASANPWETDYEAICRKFREAGYEETVPEIVFWNLRDSTSIPVPSLQKGVALVSGFSKNLVKLFLEGRDGVLNPRTVMETAIAGEEYQKLVVFD